MIYNPILSSEPLTVLSEFKPKENSRTSYQSEEQLEKEFISQLQNLSYEYLPLKDKDDLKRNLRVQIQSLNSFIFKDQDWEMFYDKYIANDQQGIIEKTKLIQSDKVIIDFELSDGTKQNIKLIDKENPFRNSFQVINQFESNSGKHKNRYDVTVLINGLPIVHIELKRRGVAIREAFNQINRYGRESFWSNDSLFEFVQLFVISNGTNTLYYSNTTRHHKVFQKDVTETTWRNTCNWADQKNNQIKDLVDFTSEFFKRNILLNIVSKYCILNTRNELMVLRPYQISAIERIMSKVNIADKSQLFGTHGAGGYIWHTTGSGKTLTSFKTAQLLTKHPSITKVFFVVDRSDLDHQTIQEYNKFQEGCVVENKSTKELEAQINNPDRKIIVTTIQKLVIFLKKTKKHNIFKENVVLIFDECHRSQFGEMQRLIQEKFKKHIMFGFTGTPILAENANSFETTESIFGACLHTYTIQNAINDEKVLKFSIEYVQTIKEKDNIQDEEVKSIDTEEVLISDERIDKIVEYIEDHYKQKVGYSFRQKSFKFNSILACQNIEAAKKYYSKLKDKFKVATIFSYKQNEEVDGIQEESLDDTNDLPKSSKDFLNDAISDYNNLFKTSFNVTDQFAAYYRDLSKKVKENQIDILIVVNMFLTGFDSKCTNTLWVDKNLRYHGLIQAFSRTNRVLDETKPHGNIVCFRPLEKDVKNAVKLFADENSQSLVLVEPFDVLFEEYKELVSSFKTNFPEHTNVTLVGESRRKLFIQSFSKILSKRNILRSFSEFSDILTEMEFQDYSSIYCDERDKIIRSQATEKESIMDDVEFEVEILKTVSVDVDYILNLISKEVNNGTKISVIKDVITSKVNGSILLRSKKELIEEFLNNIDPDIQNFNAEELWQKHYEKRKEEELIKIINDEKLDEEKLRKFLFLAFRKGEISFDGTTVTNMFTEKISILNNQRTVKRLRIEERLEKYFNEFN